MKNLLYAIKFQFYIIHNFNLNVFYTIRFWFRMLFKKYKRNYYSAKVKNGWNLTFEENFTDSTIDWTKWNKWWSENGMDESQHLAKPSLNCLQLDGDKLKILVQKSTDSTDSTFKYETGVLFSSYVESWINGVKRYVGFQQMFGYFEIRCKVPKQGRQFWPAFWLWNNTWPPEIDVFEFMSKKDVGKDYSKRISFTSHWGYMSKKNRNNYFGTQLGKTKKIRFDCSEDFHVYGCKWSPYSIKWYIDDVCVYQHIYNIPTTEMSIVVNCSIPVELPPNDNDLPVEFIVDYIRAYKKSE